MEPDGVSFSWQLLSQTRRFFAPKFLFCSFTDMYFYPFLLSFTLPKIVRRFEYQMFNPHCVSLSAPPLISWSCVSSSTIYLLFAVFTVASGCAGACSWLAFIVLYSIACDSQLVLRGSPMISISLQKTAFAIQRTWTCITACRSRMAVYLRYDQHNQTIESQCVSFVEHTLCASLSMRKANRHGLREQSIVTAHWIWSFALITDTAVSISAKDSINKITYGL